MAMITLKINEKSKAGQVFIAFLKQFIVNNNKAVEVVNLPNEETLKAIEDVEKGNIFRVKNSKQLFNELGI